MGEVTNIKYLRDIITEKLWGFENLLSRTAGTHCFGDSFTIADAALMPQANACRSSFGLDLSIFPTISRVLANIEKLDCVQKTHPDVCPDAVKTVAKPSAQDGFQAERNRKAAPPAVSVATKETCSSAIGALTLRHPHLMSIVGLIEAQR